MALSMVSYTVHMIHSGALIDVYSVARSHLVECVVHSLLDHLDNSEDSYSAVQFLSLEVRLPILLHSYSDRFLCKYDMTSSTADHEDFIGNNNNFIFGECVTGCM